MAVALLMGEAVLTVAPSAASRPAPQLLDGVALAAVYGEAATRHAATIVPVPAPATANVPRPVRVRPASGAVTGPYGEPRGGGRRHPGIDFDGVTGDPVLAAAGGTVLLAGPAPAGFGGYGTLVLVDHGTGVQTLYAHLSAVVASAGQPVVAGQQIGAIGTTGHVTGSHLHFELHVNGLTVDPGPWLSGR